jgi:hypothetical protein
MALNIFGQPPEYLSGLLGVDPEKLRKQAMTTGLINTALAFAAQPRNRGYGSVLPYAAQALMAGQQGAQGVYQGALQDFQTKQKIEEIKRQQEQNTRRQSAIQKFGVDNPMLQAAAEAFPEQVIPQAALKSLETQKRETFVAPDGSIRFKDTGEVAQKDIVRAPEKRETVIAPNGMLIYKDTGEPVTQRSFAAPKEPSKPNYKVETDATGKVVFIPQQPGMPIVDIAGKPTTYTPKDSTKPPTEGERKSATLLKRMEGSLAQLNEAVKTDPSAATPEFIPEALRAASLGIVEAPANIMTSSNRQKVEAAQLDILDAALTLGTGAAYTKEQLQGYRKSYFPQIGDSDETVEDKRQRLNNVIEAAKIAAGSAAGNTERQQRPSDYSGSGMKPSAPPSENWSIRKKQ